ncbi:uncharacterized protein F5147DRAFT_818398 [Suillus discolor]|uniref:F-box domain-containing protein n=1 Tax=Suillus discolor TaxID=1912936 RepID=A0A9P7EYU9_9AGAM|nr:uncharacterized protein F5147DRAFT_818398 [Suillus discolor]KAG2096292.1 hypothetical protein F5147DRAFT_818398 [Suillus discolor]
MAAQQMNCPSYPIGFIGACGLVTLSGPMLDWAAWKHLSCLPTLLKLKIDQGCIDPPSLPTQDIVNLSFLNITSLSFRQLFDAADFITVMQHSQFPSLKEFEFEAHFLSSEEAEQLFHALSSCNAYRTLEEITIISYDNDIIGPEYDEFLTPIPHLLCFTQLQTLKLISETFHIYLDNDMLLQAMSSWPHIRTLEIEEFDPPSEVTLRGLFTALGPCPQLHTLQVPIKIATIDIDPDTEPIQHTSLRSLDLEKSKLQIADAESLACIISTWLPCVDQSSVTPRGAPALSTGAPALPMVAPALLEPRRGGTPPALRKTAVWSAVTPPPRPPGPAPGAVTLPLA